MDNSSGMRGGGGRYLLDQGAVGRYSIQQGVSGTAIKRPVSGYNQGTTYRQQQQQFSSISNNRLIAQPPPAPSTNKGLAPKKSFAADSQNEFPNQAQRFARIADKSKGLRQFSAKVCEKVKEKGITTYNEVADELVSEHFASIMPLSDYEKHSYDIKNIRRRVYDALNVLMAMNILEKEKKEIRWVGLPTSSVQENKNLEKENARRRERIRQKTDTLSDLVVQLVAYKSLVERNRERERKEGRPQHSNILRLPFVIVSTDKSASVECHIAANKTEFLFHFDRPFDIQDDIEVLKRLGFSQGLESGEVSNDVRAKIKRCLPTSLRGYVDSMIDGASAPMRPMYQKVVEHKRPVSMSSHSQLAASRPMVRVNRALQGQPPNTVTVPRFVVRQPAHPQQQRYVTHNTPVLRQPQERYGYGQANGWPKQYVQRHMYATTQEYMEELYDEEEDEEILINY